MSVWIGEAVLAALLVSEIKARRTLSLKQQLKRLACAHWKYRDLRTYREVSFARMAVLRSVRRVLINGGRVGPVEFHRTA